MNSFWGSRWAVGLLLFLASGVLGAKSAAAATSIVAERTPEKVVVAADSKVFHFLDGSVGAECKILLRRKVGFAESGIPGYRATGFDSKSLALRALLAPGSVTSKEASFEALVKPELVKVGDALQKHARDLFQRLKDAPLEVFFFGLEDGIPTLIETRFQFVGPTQGTVSVKLERRKCPGDCSISTELRFLGYRSAINESYARNPGIVRGDPENVTAKLVQIEIEQESDYVGPPITVLRIDKSGPKWIKLGACRSATRKPVR